jgi:hypothetical protein
MRPALSRWLDKFVREAPSSEPRNAVGQALWVMLRGECPKCAQALNGHRYQIYAMTVATSERNDVLVDFIQKARHHEWKSLLRSQDFDPVKNSLEIYALQCPEEFVSMLLVRDPFELCDGLSLESWQLLQGPDTRSWLTFLDPSKWVSFPCKNVGQC